MRTFLESEENGSRGAGGFKVPLLNLGEGVRERAELHDG
jgi:hypothetical protein